MNDSFGLSNSTITKINSILRNYALIKKASIYGSRAKGNYKEGSDIDIVLFGSDISIKELRNIYDDLDELLLPYTFDISVYEHLQNEELKNHINRVGIEFYLSPNKK